MRRTYHSTKRHFAACVIAAAGIGAATAALAQDHPVFLPTKDVAVTYQLTSGGEPAQTTHLYFSAAANKLRIDTPGNGGFTVLDRAAGQRLMVMNQDHSYVAVPLDPAMADGFVLNSTMSYKRSGETHIDGVACTEWDVSSATTTGSACVTPDGVLLRGTGRQRDGSETGLVASAVSYAPQSDSLFQPPRGFTRIDPAQMQQREGPPGAGGPPPGGPGDNQ